MTEAQYLYIFGPEIEEEYKLEDIQAESPFTRNVPAKHSCKIVGGIGVYFKPI